MTRALNGHTPKHSQGLRASWHSIMHLPAWHSHMLTSSTVPILVGAHAGVCVGVGGSGGGVGGPGGRGSRYKNSPLVFPSSCIDMIFHLDQYALAFGCKCAESASYDQRYHGIHTHM
eukprot:c52357_g1_i1 orf=128-478(+)